MVKKGQVYYPVLGGTPIRIIKPSSGNGHWATKKLNNSANSHNIHEGTLKKFFTLVPPKDRELIDRAKQMYGKNTKVRIIRGKNDEA